MISRGRESKGGALLDSWRPPHGAGDPIGCLATTYTFEPGLFDEQCLARFLEIESEPDREDLAFLLERECRLGGTYAGVLVDHTQSGVVHSLRWDVLPVRISTGRQHAKLSVLAWSRHIRIIIASANLSTPGYRSNFEVAASVDLNPDHADLDTLSDSISFLRSLIERVPGAASRTPEVRRAETFLFDIARRAGRWGKNNRRTGVHHRLVCTLPSGQHSRSSLEEAVEECRRRGGSPSEAWVASPFFDEEEGTERVTSSLCKLMARGARRTTWFSVPAIRDARETGKPRLAAPKSLLLTPPRYHSKVCIEMLPATDEADNRRAWHAKMLALFSGNSSALMIGSSNFTCAGMGIGPRRNAEANLLTCVSRGNYDRQAGKLESVWPDMEEVRRPERAEWLGAQAGQEEEGSTAPPVPAGFLSATYHAGKNRRIVLHLAPSQLPKQWSILSCGQRVSTLLSARLWRTTGRPAVVDLVWEPMQPPERLLVRWSRREAFLPLNIEDSHQLPPPPQIESMKAEDMLLVLAAADPSAAFRTWAKRQRTTAVFDEDLDSSTPADLDPLRRYELEATFLHRIRRRARTLAQLRANLERPVWSLQALEWRLRGLIGIQPLADRLVREFASAAGGKDEALLTLADFLIVLREVDYKPRDGSLKAKDFRRTFRHFLRGLAKGIENEVDAHREGISTDLLRFWHRVVNRCRR